MNSNIATAGTGARGRHRVTTEIGYSQFVVPLGRAFFAALFITTLFGHFSSEAIGYAAAAGVPLPNLLVPASGVVAFAGGLSVLLGYRAKLGAWLLVLFLVPVTLMMHNFWAADDPLTAQMQQGMFMKNLSLIGAALLITHLGAGPVSFDAFREDRPETNR